MTKKAFLLKQLPSQMIPNYFVNLDILPHSSSGKVNDKQLPEISETHVAEQQTNYIPPSTEIETMLVEIMENILGRKPIGVQDNFFKIGGNSLKAARFFQRVNTRIPGAMQMSDMFMYSNIESLAKHIEEFESHENQEDTPDGDEEIQNFKKITI